MEKIRHTVVASGIIGQYRHEWEVHELCDVKSESVCYVLYINKENVGHAFSISKALAMLVEQFDE